MIIVRARVLLVLPSAALLVYGGAGVVANMKHTTEKYDQAVYGLEHDEAAKRARDAAGELFGSITATGAMWSTETLPRLLRESMEERAETEPQIRVTGAALEVVVHENEKSFIFCAEADPESTNLRPLLNDGACD